MRKLCNQTSMATPNVEQLVDNTTNLDNKYGEVVAAVAFGRVTETGVKHFRLCRATEALTIIDYNHNAIHAATTFWYDDVVQLASAASQDYLITVPDTTTWPHWGYDIESTAGGVVVELYEAGDRTGTTLQTSYNRNRNSSATATTTIHKGQSGGTTDGTRIVWRSSGTGTAAGRISGTAGEVSERVLKQNTKYILRITSKANTNDISVRLNWYELANRN